jgi:hypothetical protein
MHPPTSGAAPKGLSDPTLQILLTDYASAREDERHSKSLIGGLVAVAIPFLALSAGFLVGSCGPDPQSTTNCVRVAPWFHAAIPLPLLGLFSWALITYGEFVARGFYMENLETAIQQLQPVAAGQIRKIPSYHRFIHPVVGLTAARPFQLLGFTTWVILVGGLGVVTVWCIRLTGPHSLAVVAAVFYSVVGAWMIGVLLWITLGRQHFEKYLVAKLRATV